LNDLKDESHRDDNRRNRDERGHGKAGACDQPEADQDKKPPRAAATIACDPMAKPRQQHAGRNAKRPFAAAIDAVRWRVRQNRRP
jgi:hypothetical protein